MGMLLVTGRRRQNVSACWQNQVASHVPSVRTRVWREQAGWGREWGDTEKKISQRYRGGGGMPHCLMSCPSCPAPPNPTHLPPTCPLLPQKCPKHAMNAKFLCCLPSQCAMFCFAMSMFACSPVTCSLVGSTMSAHKVRTEMRHTRLAGTAPSRPSCAVCSE